MGTRSFWIRDRSLSGVKLTSDIISAVEPTFPMLPGSTFQFTVQPILAGKGEARETKSFYRKLITRQHTALPMSSGSFFQLINRGVVNLTTGFPKATIIVATVITLILLRSATHFEKNMTRDIEVYLPEGDEATGLLLEVRQEWSTDTLLIIVESRNAWDPERYVQDPRDNITAVETLKTMSALEVAIDPWGQSREQERNFGSCYQSIKGADRGECDGIVFTLSLSTIIKELNSTTPRFVNAVEKKSLGSAFGQVVHLDDDQLNDTGVYDIPDSQERIDELVNRTGKTANNYALDTNGDGIWDTASILFALNYEELDNDEAQREHIDKVNAWIAGLEHPEQPTMGVTGLVVVLHEVTDRIYDDLLLMLPLAMGIVVVMMLMYHRTPRILPVVAIPVIFSIIWTLGLVQLSGVVLTPMIVAAGPILVGIGVDYGLHVANRINECQFEEGLTFHKSVSKGLATTGRATLLCAVTDIIGFSALMISPISPMRTVGLTMIVGVTSAFILTILLVPPLMMLTNYRKGETRAWQKVGSIPVKNWWIILLLITMLTMASLAKVEVMQEDIRGDESAPDEIESIQLLAQYSEQFDAGQTGIVITRADEERRSDPDMLTAANDTEVLDIINATESEISSISINNRNSGEPVNISAVSIIDFFKAAHVELTIEFELIDQIFEPVTLSGSYWDLIHHPFFTSDNFAYLDDPNLPYTRTQLRNDIIEVFYESFSGEIIAMLISDDYQKALIYVEMPYINIDDTQVLIDLINEITEYNDLMVPNGEVAHLTGGPPITVAINAGIQETQWKTIKLSLMLVLGALFAMFYLTSNDRLSPATMVRSLGFAVATIIPILIVVAWQPMTMSAGSTNVNIFTAMIGTIIIGIGIDNAVQISERIREEGVNEEGIARAVEFTGASLVEATSTTAGGIAAGVLISLFRTQFVGLQNFFLLIIILIFYTLVGGLLVLPAIYTASLRLKNNLNRRRGKVVRRAVRLPGTVGVDADGKTEVTRPLATKPAWMREKPPPDKLEPAEAEPLEADDLEDTW